MGGGRAIHSGAQGGRGRVAIGPLACEGQEVNEGLWQRPRKQLVAPSCLLGLAKCSSPRPHASWGRTQTAAPTHLRIGPPGSHTSMNYTRPGSNTAGLAVTRNWLLLDYTTMRFCVLELHISWSYMYLIHCWDRTPLDVIRIWRLQCCFLCFRIIYILELYIS